MAFSTSTVFLDGRTLAYTDTGGEGTPVLLAHGFALDKTMFAAQAVLAPRWRLIAWDARGHGETTSDERPYSYWDAAADQLALMDALGIAAAVIGGVSQGGFTALRTALVAPERVAALLLWDTEAAALDPQDSQAYRQLFAALAEQGPVEPLLVGLAEQIIGEHPAAAEWVRRWGLRGVPLGAAVDCLVGRDDITGRLPEIVCPALLARGERDRSIPVERMDRLRAALPGATAIEVVAGAGHSPTITHPDAATTVIGRFLAELG